MRYLLRQPNIHERAHIDKHVDKYKCKTQRHDARETQKSLDKRAGRGAGQKRRTKEEDKRGQNRKQYHHLKLAMAPTESGRNMADMVTESQAIKERLQGLSDLWKSEKLEVEIEAQRTPEMQAHLLEVIVPGLLPVMDEIIDRVKEFQSKWPGPLSNTQKARIKEINSSLETREAILKAKEEAVATEKGDIQAQRRLLQTMQQSVVNDREAVEAAKSNLATESESLRRQKTALAEDSRKAKAAQGNEQAAINAQRDELRAEKAQFRKEMDEAKAEFKKETNETKAELKREKDELKAEKADFKRERDLLMEALKARSRSPTPSRQTESHFYFPGQSKSNTPKAGGIRIFSRKHNLDPSPERSGHKRPKLQRKSPPPPEPAGTASIADEPSTHQSKLKSGNFAKLDGLFSRARGPTISRASAQDEAGSPAKAQPDEKIESG